ncbi:MAG: TonB-dependent receptor [Hyphomonadaceae bacterium]|nr:TonB-dependent receptor [Hyphomonadaceae bacterium]
MSKASLILTTALVCAGLGPVSAAWAQSQGTAPDQQATSSESAEIVVTAQRREQRLVDVPIAITAVDAARLEDSQINRIADLPQMVTGLRIDSNGSYGQPSIRGVGNSIAGTGFSNNVAVYVDGFYQPTQNTTDSMFLNLEGIEVLKGPQGTLFGRNATGGAILMHLRGPSFDPTLQARASYSRFNTAEVAVYGSTGLTETLAADLSFASETSDGYVTNIATGNEEAGAYNNWSARISLLWQPMDAVSFHLAYQHADQDDARPYIFNVEPDPATGVPQSLGELIPGGIVATQPGDVSYEYPNNFLSTVDSVFLTSEFDIGTARLTSYTMYRDEENTNYFDQDGSSVELFNTLFFLQNETFTQEFNLSGTNGPLDWLLGAFYYDSQSHQGPFPITLGAALTGGAPLTTELYSAEQDATAWALFADVTYQMAERWYLTVGARYSEEEAEGWYNIDPVAQAALGIGLAVGAVPGQSPTFSHSWDSFTPRVSIRYELSPDSSVFLTYSEGFKAGQLTPNAFVTTPLEPEKISAYELGYRYVGADTRFDASVFHYDYEDLQLAFYVSGTGIYRNAANSEIYGAELQYSTQLTNTLALDLGVAYTHAEYTDFASSPNWVPTGLGTYAAVSVDASGFQMQRSPEWTANIGLRNETPLAGGRLSLSGNYYYTSEFPFDTSEQFMEDAYGILNLRAAWTDPSNRWEVALFGTNVTDEEYRVQVLPGDFAFQQIWGKPASYGVSLSLALN